MFNVLSIAASGMRAAELRLQVAARNAANADTVGSLPNAVGAKETREPYKPLTAVQSTIEGGGVKVALRERVPSYIEVYCLSSPYADARGIVAAPNADLAEEAMNVVNAEVSFKANASVVRAALEMFDALMDALDSDHDDCRCWRITV